MGDSEPHSPELADELAIGRMKAGAELLSGGCGESVGKRGLELGDTPSDHLVRWMNPKPRSFQEGNRIHAGCVRILVSVDQHLGQVHR